MRKTRGTVTRHRPHSISPSASADSDAPASGIGISESRRLCRAAGLPLSDTPAHKRISLTTFYPCFWSVRHNDRTTHCYLVTDKFSLFLIREHRTVKNKQWASGSLRISHISMKHKFTFIHRKVEKGATLFLTITLKFFGRFL